MNSVVLLQASWDRDQPNHTIVNGVEAAMAETSITIVIKAQLRRDRGLLAGLKIGKITHADLKNSGYDTEAQLLDLQRRITENETALRIYNTR